MNKLLAGLDIGNGYVKGAVFGNTMASIDMPSGVAFLTNTNDIKVSDSEAKEVIDDIYNQMDVSFDSPLVKDQTRRLFGRRGISSGMSLEEFDVSSHLSKSQQDLSGVLVLGSLAGKALQDYFVEHSALPKDMVKVKVRAALALPIREYKKYRKAYAEGFMSCTHIVTFHNFEKPIRIELTFEDVQVLAEGASAQYAITAKGPEFMDSMLSDVRRMGNPLEGITSADILQAMNTVGVDIGEGTVNFPVFQNGKFNVDASMTFDKGYGYVLNNALDRIADLGMPISSRKALSEFLQTPPSKLSQARYNAVKQIVDEEINAFTNEVKMQFTKVLSHVGAYVEVVYVYGGGATPIKDYLYPKLIEISKELGGTESMYPILYLDSRYSRHLNREGLFTVVDSYAKHAKKK